MNNDLDRRFLLGSLAGAAGVSALSAMAKGGPITPPAGPVTGTGKTLAEVEPRTALTPAMAQTGTGVVYNLTTPGSYYLTGDVTVPPNSTGVFLWNGSSLDLNGFSIIGTDGTGLGVRTTAGSRVRNGRIRNLQYGVEYYFSTDADNVVEDLIVTNCSVRGILLNSRAIVRRCTVTGPGALGIECTNDYALIEDCVVSGASVVGVYINSFSSLRGCKLLGNGSSGAGNSGGGAYVGYGSRVERCTFDANIGIALRTAGRAVVESCNHTNTTFGAAVGLELGEGGTALACAFSGNPYGVRAGNGARVAGCSFDGNSVVALKADANAVHADGCTFTRNTSAVEMTSVSGCAVTRCTLLGNTSTIATNNALNSTVTTSFANASSAVSPLVNLVG